MKCGRFVFHFTALQSDSAGLHLLKSPVGLLPYHCYSFSRIFSHNKVTKPRLIADDWQRNERGPVTVQVMKWKKDKGKDMEEPSKPETILIYY